MYSRVDPRGFAMIHEMKHTDIIILVTCDIIFYENRKQNIIIVPPPPIYLHKVCT